MRQRGFSRLPDDWRFWLLTRGGQVANRGQARMVARKTCPTGTACHEAQCPVKGRRPAFLSPLLDLSCIVEFTASQVGDIIAVSGEEYLGGCLRKPAVQRSCPTSNWHVVLLNTSLRTGEHKAFPPSSQQANGIEPAGRGLTQPAPAATSDVTSECQLDTAFSIRLTWWRINVACTFWHRHRFNRKGRACGSLQPINSDMTRRWQSTR